MTAARVRLRPLDAATYQRHALHGEDRTWAETNCYVDLWIESLHGFGLDPMPALAFTLALDFEGDQYTFYKFAHADLYELYGIDVQELNVWKPIVEHAVEQVTLGRLFIVETDAFWLPDTVGVSHQIDHVKTSIAIQDIDVPARRLGYFHGASYYELAGADFDGALRLTPDLMAPEMLPPFTEIAKFGAGAPPPADTLAERAVALVRTYLARRPAVNPIARHRDHFTRDLAWLLSEGNATRFHAYAFATFRQLGSCFEVAGSFLTWLGERGESGLAEAAAESEAISRAAKSIQFKLARAVTLKRDVDFASSFDAMITSWDKTMAILATRYGR